MQPHKICRNCGQPSALYLKACLRCGTPFDSEDSQTTPLDSRTKGTIRSESPSIVGPDGGRAGNRTWIAGIIAAAVLIALIVLASRTISSRAPVSAGSMGGGSTNPVSSNAAPTASVPPSGLVTSASTSSPGAFVESASSVEMPTINITENAPGTSTVLFTSADHHAYRMVIDPGTTATQQMPPGTYNFVLVPEDPNVRGQSGDATFQRFKAYSLYIRRVSPEEAPGSAHIGDD